MFCKKISSSGFASAVIYKNVYYTPIRLIEFYLPIYIRLLLFYYFIDKIKQKINYMHLHFFNIQNLIIIEKIIGLFLLDIFYEDKNSGTKFHRG